MKCDMLNELYGKILASFLESKTLECEPGLGIMEISPRRSDPELIHRQMHSRNIQATQNSSNGVGSFCL